MKYLIFDTETTGLPNYKLPVNHTSQPHIVQLAALLCDDIGQTYGQINLIIEPVVEVPKIASDIHGITTEIAQLTGVNIAVALQCFTALYDKCDMLVAHNIEFDLQMIRRYYPYDLAGQKWFDYKPGFCTKLNSTAIVKAPLNDRQLAAKARNPGWTPPGGWPEYKDPTLAECYKHFFNKEIEGAHNAMVDVEACRDVFLSLKKVEGKADA